MKYDVIVVGAGIIGLTTAECLLRQGLNVLILERGYVGNECSWAGGGILSPLIPWNYPQSVTHLTQFSTGKFSEWVTKLHTATNIDPEYNRCGMRILPPHNLEKATHWCSKNNITMHQLALPIFKNKTIYRKETKKMILLPDVAQIRNPRLLSALHQYLIQLRGKVVENCSVYSIVVKKDKVISLHTSCGRFAADQYVITAGVWSKEVLGQYALDLDIRPICGQMLLFKFEKPPIPAIYVKGNTYLIPRKDGHLLVGSTLEDKGFNKQITISARNQILQNALAILPELYKKPLVHQWSGLRPATYRNIPTIGQHPDLTNLYINSGHFRYGITMAPGSAVILANTILGRSQPFDTRPYQVGWKNL